jgi:predicted acyltransferase
MNTPPATSPPAAESPAGGAARRLISLDALRGFDMFWIIGADALVSALHRLKPTPTTGFLATQLQHVDWQGLHFYDLIFPLFVFIVGVSLVFSLGKTIERAGRAAALVRIVRRSVLLFLLGIFFSGGVSGLWPDIRLMGVLNRIALAYFFTGILFCFFRPRTLAGIGAALLLGYWALLALVPIRDLALESGNLARVAEQRGDSAAAALLRQGGNPSAVKDSPEWAAAEQLFYSTTNYVRGGFDKGRNLANHLDFEYLPGRKYDTWWDPEGYLSTIPAVVTCLLGVFAGLLLRDPSRSDYRKLTRLLAWGAAGIVLGRLWGLEFPVIKKIWTSSYVLVAGGYSALLLAMFYLVVDIWKFRTWCRPFIWIGMNSITLYLVSEIIGWHGFAERLVGGNVGSFLDHHLAQGSGELTICVVGLLLAFAFARFLYRRNIFLRL